MFTINPWLVGLYAFAVLASFILGFSCRGFLVDLKWAGYQRLIRVFGGGAGIALIAWQISSFNYRAQMDSLIHVNAELRDTYEVIMRKAEGLFEPILWKSGQLHFYHRKGESRFTFDSTIRMHGGMIEFSPDWIDSQKGVIILNYANIIDGITDKRPRYQEGLVNYHPLTMNIGGDSFEFKANDRPHILRIESQFPIDTLISWEIWALEPIYKQPPRMENDQ